MRLAFVLACLGALPCVAEPSWTAQPVSLGLSVGGRWVEGVALGGSGRQYSVKGAGPVWGFSGAFGWSRGALRLGGLASYELMISNRDLDGTASGPLRSLDSTGLPVRSAHFFSAGPSIGAQLGDHLLRGYADVAMLADVTAAEVEDAGLRLGLRFVPTARLGGSVQLDTMSIELWIYGSTLVTPRVGLVVALGF